MFKKALLANSILNLVLLINIYIETIKRKIFVALCEITGLTFLRPFS